MRPSEGEPQTATSGWLELVLHVRGGEQEQVEAALEDAGALSLSLQDADAGTPDERAIFEPGAGETPLWREITLSALFDPAIDRLGLVAVLSELLPDIAPEQMEFRALADRDWVRAWMDRFQPMRFGRRLWVYPWNIEPPTDDRDAVVVRLDPGLAFGTGTHPTTALCLEWLDSLELHDMTVVDYGCGSGILAIAALKLGAGAAIAIDNDPQALTSSRSNAERNDVAERLRLRHPDELVPLRADALVANILAGPLEDLAPRFGELLKPGAPIALSGILAGQEPALLERYAEDFRELVVAEREGWLRISGCRR